MMWSKGRYLGLGPRPGRRWGRLHSAVGEALVTGLAGVEEKEM